MLSLGLGQARAEQHIKQTFRVYYRVEVYSENGVTRSADILVTTESRCSNVDFSQTPRLGTLANFCLAMGKNDWRYLSLWEGL